MKKGKKHGKSGTRLYNVWSGMKDRCYNKNCRSYRHYGGRGIVVCDEWKDDFMCFYEWAMANGYDEAAPRGQYTIERKENDGPYSPENCRWATIQEQERNKRNNVLVLVGDGVKVLKEACEDLGLNYSTERKTRKRRSSGVRAMSDYNEARRVEAGKKADELKRLIEDNPTWSNVRLGKAMGVTEGYVRKLKKAWNIGV